MERPMQEYDEVAAWRALKLVKEVAEMTKDGELDDEGEEYVIENDDAWETVMSLISEAREILGVPVDRPCQDGHDGPVVPTGRHEIIDDGIAFYVRCEACGQAGDGSIDLDEIGWHDD